MPSSPAPATTDWFRGVVAIDFTPFIDEQVFVALGQRIGSGNRLFADIAPSRPRCPSVIR